MGKCVVIVGGTASGKTTLAKALENKGFRRILTYTTRPMRFGEEEGIDYHFISQYEFNMRVKDKFFAEATAYHATFGYCCYGSSKYDYNSKDNTVIVLNPRGVINLTEPAIIVYLDLDKKILSDRALKRGDSALEIDRRLNDDDLFFEEMLAVKTPDITITKVHPVDTLVDVIINKVKES